MAVCLRNGVGMAQKMKQEKQTETRRWAWRNLFSEQRLPARLIKALFLDLIIVVLACSAILSMNILFCSSQGIWGDLNSFGFVVGVIVPIVSCLLVGAIVFWFCRTCVADKVNPKVLFWGEDDRGLPRRRLLIACGIFFVIVCVFNALGLVRIANFFDEAKSKRITTPVNDEIRKETRDWRLLLEESSGSRREASQGGGARIQGRVPRSTMGDFTGD